MVRTILLYNAVMVGDTESMTGTWGCGFLRGDEVAACLDRRLAAPKWRAFEAHLEGGCASCALLAADIAAGNVVLSETSPGGAGAEQRSRADFLARRILRQQQGAKRSLETLAKNRRWLSVAVAALLLLAAIPALLHLGNPPTASNIVLPGGAVFEIEALEFSEPPVVRDRVGAAEALREAGQLYRRGAYHEAAEAFARAGALDASAFDPALFEGISRVMAGEDERALSALARARSIAEADFLPTETVAWFEGLALLRLGRVEQARRALEEARGSLSFGERVPALLEALKSDE